MKEGRRLKSEGKSRKAAAGFTIVELMITMVAFVFVIAAASQMLTGLMTQFKQQSKIAETNIEGIVGLNILRQDIEHAGYGLPWVIPGASYSEATSDAAICGGTADPSTYNDSTANPPRAIVSGNNNCVNSSDYLVIKALNVAGNDPSKKSTHVISTSPYVRTWTPSSEDLDPTDRVIVINGGAGDNMRELIESGGTFYTTYNNVANATWRPSESSIFHIVYGINDNSASLPRMPFNRADYYISTSNVPAPGVPARCAPGTGVLYKAALNHGSGALALDRLPILDCVADLQVIFRLDTNGDGTIDNPTDDISALTTAEDIREQVKEIRVYILTHEGQRDPNYIYPTNPLTVGEFGLGSSFNFSTAGITDWQNYRWKVYTIVVKPENLGS